MKHLATRLMEYERGWLNKPQQLELFQALVDSGLVWKLQGNYGRTAAALLEAGEIHPPGWTLGVYDSAGW